MKLCNVLVNNQEELAIIKDNKVYSLGNKYSMIDVIKGHQIEDVKEEIKNPQFRNIINPVGKIICVGLNYPKHAKGIKLEVPQVPLLFSKYQDSLTYDGSDIKLYDWENSYDYEGELVIVIGKEAFDVSKEEALDCVFGYTIGNDLSCREAQMRTSQWLIGKAMPNFGPCGPIIVTKDEFDYHNKTIKSFVNGEKRQDGNTNDMFFKVEDIVSYASKYLKLNPGDLIFTGTPDGVALEARVDKRRYLEKGDVVRVEIEGIGSLTNKMI